LPLHITVHGKEIVIEDSERQPVEVWTRVMQSVIFVQYRTGISASAANTQNGNT